jgi:hypothetical protein
MNEPRHIEYKVNTIKYLWYWVEGIKQNNIGIMYSIYCFINTQIDRVNSDLRILYHIDRVYSLYSTCLLYI